MKDTFSTNVNGYTDIISGFDDSGNPIGQGNVAMDNFNPNNNVNANMNFNNNNNNNNNAVNNFGMNNGQNRIMGGPNNQNQFNGQNQFSVPIATSQVSQPNQPMQNQAFQNVNVNTGNNNNFIPAQIQQTPSSNIEQSGNLIQTQNNSNGFIAQNTLQAQQPQTQQTITPTINSTQTTNLNTNTDVNGGHNFKNLRRAI
jgi:hypothetical protein